MKRIFIALALAAAPAAATAQTAQDLIKDQDTPGDVLTYGMGYGQQRYSKLTQIGKTSVKRLVPVWNFSLNNPQAQENQPIISDGVMYVSTHTETFAIDALTGKQVWRNTLEFAADVPKMACCGLINRGVAIYQGKVFRTTLDAKVQALDARTGKELWKSTAIDYKLGHAMTVAPLVANGVLITGIASVE